MKIALLYLAFVTATFAADEQIAKSIAPAAISGFAYIHDATKFQCEDSKKLTPEERRALKFAKGVLALRFDSDVDGKFSIAEASWGYQVNFTALKHKKNGDWVELSEGFGEVFLSKQFNRIQIDYGP